jgi:hypothetical protein
MTLKDLFLSLAFNKQKVEIYFFQEDLTPIFAFRINDKDSSIIEGDKLDLICKIEAEINNGFLGSSLVENFEGDTSYFLLADGFCVKTAKYFSWVGESEQFWIENHETNFKFGKVNLPFDSILISKSLDSFVLSEERKLKAILGSDRFQDFFSFYFDLLQEFQEMEIELQFDKQDDGNLFSYILSMDGSYSQNLEFTLLDSSINKFSLQDLEMMLIDEFEIDPILTTQILNIKSNL